LKGGIYTVCVDKPGWTADGPCAIVYLDCQDEEQDFDVYKGRNTFVPETQQSKAISLVAFREAIVPGAMSVEPSGAIEPDIGGDGDAGRQPAAPEIT